MKARDGIVTLAGPVLREEADQVRRMVADLPGVTGVEDRLEIKEQASDLPASAQEQQQEDRWQPKPEPLQQRWAPAPRLLAGAAGGGLVCYGIVRRGPSGLLAGSRGRRCWPGRRPTCAWPASPGSAPAAGPSRSKSTSRSTRRSRRCGGCGGNYENFPRFMTNVREVRKSQGGRSHWKVAGPLGATVSWDAEETRRVPNELLAWKSKPGAAIQHAGVVRLEPVAGDRTRIDVTLSYNPVAGAAGHAVASILGADPKQQLDEDLLRMKTLVETGTPPHDAAKPD